MYELRELDEGAAGAFSPHAVLLPDSAPPSSSARGARGGGEDGFSSTDWWSTFFFDYKSNAFVSQLRKFMGKNAIAKSPCEEKSCLIMRFL